MFPISILVSEQVKLMQFFLSTYVTGDIELIFYYSFLVIQHVFQSLLSYKIPSWLYPGGSVSQNNTKLLKYDNGRKILN